MKWTCSTTFSKPKYICSPPRSKYCRTDSQTSRSKPASPQATSFPWSNNAPEKNPHFSSATNSLVLPSKLSKPTASLNIGKPILRYSPLSHFPSYLGSCLETSRMDFFCLSLDYTWYLSTMTLKENHRHLLCLCLISTYLP